MKAVMKMPTDSKNNFCRWCKNIETYASCSTGTWLPGSQTQQSCNSDRRQLKEMLKQLNVINKLTNKHGSEKQIRLVTG